MQLSCPYCRVLPEVAWLNLAVAGLNRDGMLWFCEKSRYLCTYLHNYVPGTYVQHCTLIDEVPATQLYCVQYLMYAPKSHLRERRA